MRGHELECVHVHGLKDDEFGRPTGLKKWDAILIACFAAMAMRGKPMRFTEGSCMLPRRVTTTHNCTTSQETRIKVQHSCGATLYLDFTAQTISARTLIFSASNTQNNLSEKRLRRHTQHVKYEQKLT